VREYDVSVVPVSPEIVHILVVLMLTVFSLLVLLCFIFISMLKLTAEHVL